MKMQIGKWGNSLAVRLPKELVDRFDVREGEAIDSAALEAAFAARKQGDKDAARAEALKRIETTAWPLPPGYKFDREDANSR